MKDKEKRIKEIQDEILIRIKKIGELREEVRELKELERALRL